jgi:hypothetical protein
MIQDHLAATSTAATPASTARCINLSPPPHPNDDPTVLIMPHLAGTRYRVNYCPTCGAERRSATSTPFPPVEHGNHPNPTNP